MREITCRHPRNYPLLSETLFIPETKTVTVRFFSILYDVYPLSVLAAFNIEEVSEYTTIGTENTHFIFSFPSHIRIFPINQLDHSI